MRVMRNKKGDTMAFLVLDDRSGRLEVAVFADKYREYRDKLVKDALLVVEVKKRLLQHFKDSGQLDGVKDTDLEKIKWDNISFTVTVVSPTVAGGQGSVFKLTEIVPQGGSFEVTPGRPAPLSTKSVPDLSYAVSEVAVKISLDPVTPPAAAALAGE